MEIFKRIAKYRTQLILATLNRKMVKEPLRLKRKGAEGTGSAVTRIK